MSSCRLGVFSPEQLSEFELMLNVTCYLYRLATCLLMAIIIMQQHMNLITLFEGNAATASQRNCKLMQPKWGHSYMLLGCKN